VLVRGSRIGELTLTELTEVFRTPGWPRVSSRRRGLAQRHRGKAEDG